MPRTAAIMEPLEIPDVAIDSLFWSPRLRTNRQVTLFHEYRMCEKTGRINTFRLAWKKGAPHEPHRFWDSDVAKWVEAVAWTLARKDDPKLDDLLEKVVALIVGAQQPDGYLNSRFTQVEPQNRWKNLRDNHELYAAGHLMEAAVAHWQATGSRTFLDAMCRYADYIETVFGPRRGQMRGYCGHQEIELALVKLYRATGQVRYLKLAKYFLDERGRRPHYYDIEAKARGEDPRKFWAGTYAYMQADKPVRQQTEVVGHAVRAMYMLCGMADVGLATEDASLLSACRRLWLDTVGKKMYITGGIGPSGHNEGFSGAYDLPNETAYAETCAAIGLAMFAHRMLQIDADGAYADVMERCLYNGVLSGVSLDGKGFFYGNPLASAGNVARSEWHGCACCPPNIARLIASLGRYVYSASRSALYVHLYIGGSAKLALGGSTVLLTQRTDYPWDGKVSITVGLPRGPRPHRAKTGDGACEFDVMLRIPGWCRNHKLTVNRRPVSAPVAKGYARIRRAWRDGDTVELAMDMPIERMAAHPRVAEDLGKVALQRGPLVYCLEQPDNAAPVRSILFPDSAKLRARFDRKLFGGITVIEGRALSASEAPWKGKLHQPAENLKTRVVTIKAIPYAFWNNRGKHPMTVYLPRG